MVSGRFLWFYGSRSVFMVPGNFHSFFHGSRLVLMVCHGFRLNFYGSRSVFMVFLGSRLVFSRFQVGFPGFPWFQVGFSWSSSVCTAFHGSRLGFNGCIWLQVFFMVPG